MAKTAPRSYPAHQGFHWAIAESYVRESKTRIAAHRERRAKKEGVELPCHNPLEYRDFNPSDYALNILLEEKRKEKEYCEEARRNTLGVGMKPVDQATRLKLYYGISRDGEGRQHYLKTRLNLPPEDRYNLPLLSSWQYGWQIAHKEELFDRPANRRTSRIRESFFARNGIPKLLLDYPEIPTMITETHP